MSSIIISPKFKIKLVAGYQLDPYQKYIRDQIIANNDLAYNIAALPFYIHDDLLYTDDYRLYIPASYRKEVFDQVHDRINHTGLAKIVELLAPIVYIYRLSRYVRDYIQYCPKYNIFQTKRHKPYGSLQPIIIPPYLFYILTLDFILSLLATTDGFDYAATLTYKFSKKVIIVLGKSTQTTIDQVVAIIAYVRYLNQGLLKY